MTYRVHLPGTSGELTFESRDEAQGVLGTKGIRLPFAIPGPPRFMGQGRLRRRAAPAGLAVGPLAREAEPQAPGRGPEPNDGVDDDEGV